ncbi:hypothetical protein Avbf_11585 [Armadillidium vulgare]|nr:hypothetical protein Avbf_11585 [Armadillidium vulgare]
MAQFFEIFMTMFMSSAPNYDVTLTEGSFLSHELRKVEELFNFRLAVLFYSNILSVWDFHHIFLCFVTPMYKITTVSLNRNYLKIPNQLLCNLVQFIETTSFAIDWGFNSQRGFNSRDYHQYGHPGRNQNSGQRGNSRGRHQEKFNDYDNFHEGPHSRNNWRRGGRGGNSYQGNRRERFESDVSDVRTRLKEPPNNNPEKKRHPPGLKGKAIGLWYAQKAAGSSKSKAVIKRAPVLSMNASDALALNERLDNLSLPGVSYFRTSEETGKYDSFDNVGDFNTHNKHKFKSSNLTSTEDGYQNIGNSKFRKDYKANIKGNKLSDLGITKRKNFQWGQKEILKWTKNILKNLKRRKTMKDIRKC